MEKYFKENTELYRGIRPASTALIPSGWLVRNRADFLELMKEELEEKWGWAMDMLRVYDYFTGCAFIYGKGKYQDTEVVIDDKRKQIMTLVLPHGYVQFSFSSNEKKAYISLALDGFRIMDDDGFLVFLHDLDRLCQTIARVEG